MRSHCLNQWWLVYWRVYASLRPSELNLRQSRSNSCQMSSSLPPSRVIINHDIDKAWQSVACLPWGGNVINLLHMNNSCQINSIHRMIDDWSTNVNRTYQLSIYYHGVSEWLNLTAFLETADIEVHIIHISRVITALYIGIMIFPHNILPAETIYMNVFSTSWINTPRIWKPKRLSMKLLFYHHWIYGWLSL